MRERGGSFNASSPGLCFSINRHSETLFALPAMMLHLSSVLHPNLLDSVRKLLADAKFVDGKLSAGQAAQRVKHNQELDKNAKQMDTLNNLVMSALVQQARALDLM